VPELRYKRLAGFTCVCQFVDISAGDKGSACTNEDSSFERWVECHRIQAALNVFAYITAKYVHRWIIDCDDSDCVFS